MSKQNFGAREAAGLGYKKLKIKESGPGSWFNYLSQESLFPYQMLT